MQTKKMLTGFFAGMVVLLATAMAGQALAAGRSAEMFIWGGGNTQEDAQASLDQYRDRSAEWSDIVALAPEFPRILESKSVPGLKPGFIIVVLGVCAAPDAATAAKYLKALEPTVYQRSVTWSDAGGALPCPGLAKGWSFRGAERARTSAGELSGALFLQNELTEGAEFEFKRWKAFIDLRGAKGEVQAHLTDNSRSDVSIVKAFKAGASGIVLEEEYTDPLCTGEPEFKQYLRTRTYAASSGEIRAGEKERLIKQGPCSYPELGR